MATADNRFSLDNTVSSIAGEISLQAAPTPLHPTTGTFTVENRRFSAFCVERSRYGLLWM